MGNDLAKRALAYVVKHHGENASQASHNDSRDREYCEGCRIADELPAEMQRAFAEKQSDRQPSDRA